MFKFRWVVVGTLLITTPALTIAASLVTWGEGSLGQQNKPPGSDFIAASAGPIHGVALREDGTLRAWGSDFYQAVPAPTGNDYVAVSAGQCVSLALRANGSITAWGYSGVAGALNAPTDLGHTAVAAGMNFGLAINADRSLVAWSHDATAVTTVPTGQDFVAIRASSEGSWAIARRENGTLVVWGDAVADVSTPPAGTYTDFAAGWAHGVALRPNGTLVAWGSNAQGQLNNIPTGNDFVAVAAGGNYSVALRANGTLVTWGEPYHGNLNVPGGHYSAMDAGGDWGVALTPEPGGLLLAFLGLGLIRRRGA